MRRTTALTLILLTCALAGCQWSSSGSGGAGSGGIRVVVGGAGGVDALVSQLNSFTDELMSKVEAARDTKAGLAEAQALLDARKDELAASIHALKRAAPAGDARAKWLEAEVDNTDRVHRLQLKYSDEAARDAELKARLERLIADYDALFRDR